MFLYLEICYNNKHNPDMYAEPVLMHNFLCQCTELVKTYYPEFYAFLTQELDGKILCTQIGICPKNNSFDAVSFNFLLKISNYTNISLT